jgi:uncharacterized protein YegJ (DUF2314 family)
MTAPVLRFLCTLLVIVGSASGFGDTTRATDSVSFNFALYFVPEPTKDPEREFTALLDGAHRGMKEAGITVSPRWEEIAHYAPPSPNSYRYFARDLSIDQGAIIAASRRVFVLTFSASRPNLMVANRYACLLLADLADATSGIPWDDECRLIYSREAWRSSRVDTWQGDIADVRAQVSMHSYRNPELVRMITLGMRKFGYPDLVITDIPASSTRSAGNLINACAQRLLEGMRPQKNRMKLTLSEIKHSAMRTSALANPLDGATGKVELAFKEINRDEGDPANTLWLLEFPEVKADTYTERQMGAFSALYGSTDEIVQARTGDEEMRKASERARKAFFAKEAILRRGLEPNERLIVKAPFAVEIGNEYMWVEVTGWQKAAVEGVLTNDSYYDKTLRYGKRVTIPFEKIYDYIHYKPDGTEEGNETGKVLARKEQ